MLAMWHRVMTRKWTIANRVCEHTPEGSRFVKTIRDYIRNPHIRIVASELALYANEMQDKIRAIGSFGTCKPVAKSVWIECEMLHQGQRHQSGVFCCLLDQESPVGNELYLVAHFKMQHGDPVLLATEVLTFNKNGELIRASCPGVEMSPSGFFLLVMSFAHCKNVEIVDCKGHGPNEKLSRRLKVPSVIYKTLKIPGFIKRSQGEHSGDSGVEMRSHICRGHFATYTADKPLFGRPDGVGKFWHPAHVRGNAKHGAVVKDYEVTT